MFGFSYLKNGFVLIVSILLSMLPQYDMLSVSSAASSSLRQTSPTQKSSSSVLETTWIQQPVTCRSLQAPTTRKLITTTTKLSTSHLRSTSSSSTDNGSNLAESSSSPSEMQQRTSSEKPSQQRPMPSSSRQNRIAALQKWASSEAVDIKVSSKLLLQSNDLSGLGWYTTKSNNNNDKSSSELVMSVPSSVALTVECPGNGPDEASVSECMAIDNSFLTGLPWFVQMALYMHKLDRMDSTKSTTTSKQGVVLNYRPWLDSLPRQLDTPIHWSNEQLEQLQYPPLMDAVQRQSTQWRKYYDSIVLQQQQRRRGGGSSPLMTYDEFCWGCEIARSRAFAGSYTGTAFNPTIYAFTLLLVTAYVGLGLGTLEQAANGAGLVVAVSILKDFVIPKLWKKKRYVICPMIDMANHKSTQFTGEVAFEYFGNSYSLATVAGSKDGVATRGGIKVDEKNPYEQLYISYGSRSNDQLLQYYGFVEVNNPHDVYILPPIRSWNIAALEQACGRSFVPGRLELLDRAGLLGGTTTYAGKGNANDDDDDMDVKAHNNNSNGGVVVNRDVGLDPAVMQALRVLVSTNEEWNAADQAIGNFSIEQSTANEQCARIAARTALALELNSKATTLEQDEVLLRQMDSMKRLSMTDTTERLAIQFRIEKKKLLREIIEALL